MSFRLWTILYVFALLAAALATFGVFGVIPCVCVLAFWAWMFSSHKPRSVLGWFVLVAVAVAFVASLMPAFQHVREASRQRSCLNNLRQLAIALDVYASKHGSFPPAIVADESGTPLHSWRTLILPYIERGDLYDNIDRTVAWDAPANRASTSLELEMFECPSARSSSSSPGCSYFAIVGPHTAWPEGRGRPLSEITDPKSQTILLMEARDRDTPWAKPGDLTFDEAVKLLTGEVETSDQHSYSPNDGFYSQYFVKTASGIHVAMADGTVRFLALPLPKELAVALLTVDGGEGDVHNRLEDYCPPQLDVGKCCALGAFVLLSLLPIAFLRHRARNGN